MNRINLWASPRNISTAIMYSFAQRTDMTVVDEPFYASYLKETGIVHPGQEKILASQSQDFNTVLNEIILKQYKTPNVFFKQMSHHLLKNVKDFMLKCKNVILIRDPKEMIISFSKVIKSPTISDLGLKQSHEIYQFLILEGHEPVVIDSNELLKNPEKILRSLCKKLLIPFEPNMLHWEAGKRDEDGIWAPYWYTNVHQSTGFKPYHKKDAPLDPQFEELYQECVPLYLDLQKNSLKAHE